MKFFIYYYELKTHYTHAKELNMSILEKVKEKIGTLKTDVFNRIRREEESKRNNYISGTNISLKAIYDSAKTADPIMSKEELDAFARRVNPALANIDRLNTMMEDFKNEHINISSDPNIYNDGCSAAYNKALRGLIGNGENFKEAEHIFKSAIELVNQKNEEMHSGISGLYNPVNEGVNLDNIVDKTKMSMAEYNANFDKGTIDYIKESGLGINFYTQDELNKRAEMTAENRQALKNKADQISAVAKEFMEDIPAMIERYKVREIYETYAQMRKSGYPVESIKERFFNTFKGETEEWLYGLEKAYRHSNESLYCPLSYITENIEKFNKAMEDTATIKMVDEAGLNHNKNGHYNELSNGNKVLITNIEEAMEALGGASNFYNFIGLMVENNIDKAMDDFHLTFANIGAVELNPETGDAAFSLNAIYTSGLPAGIELRFNIDRNKQIFLQDILFLNTRLDRETVKRNPEFTAIISHLPDNMREKVEEDLAIHFNKETGMYENPVITDGRSKEADSNKAQEFLKKAIMTGQIPNVVMGNQGQTQVYETPETNKDEIPTDGFGIE